MPEKDRKPSRPGHDVADGADETRVSRRSLLGAAGVGAAGLAAGAFAAASPALAAVSRPDARRPDAHQPDDGPDRVPPDEPVIVHVANARTGEVDVYHGTSHTKLRDPALAARLRRAAK